jgi:Sulfotransferase family
MEEVLLDAFWIEALNFVKDNRKAPDFCMVPDELIDLLEGAYPYSSSTFGKSNRFDWIIIHKGRLDMFRAEFLQEAVESLFIVFANEVFIVLSKTEHDQESADVSTHLSPAIEYLNNTNFVSAVVENQSGAKVQSEKFDVDRLLASDPFWKNTVEFVKEHYQSDNVLLLPDELLSVFPNSHAYSENQKIRVADLHWAILHKDHLSQLPSSFLDDICSKLLSVFSNEVFAVFSSLNHIPTADKNAEHLDSFYELLQELKLVEQTISLKNNIEIISVHIPKTAGTAFGEFLCQEYQEHNFLRDYEEIPLADILNQGLIKPETRVIHGHFLASKYSKHFLKAKRIIWLRNPITRIISWYFYCLNNPEIHPMHKEVTELNMSLFEFAQLSTVSNSISDTLGDSKLEDFYFVGIQEFFHEDLIELAERLQWRKSYHNLINETKHPEYESFLEGVFNNEALLKQLISISEQDMNHYRTSLKLRAIRRNHYNLEEQFQKSLETNEKTISTLEFQSKQIRYLQLLNEYL